MCISILEGGQSYHHNGGDDGRHDGEINTNQSNLVKSCQ